MNRIEKPEWSQHPGQKPQRKPVVRSEAMPVILPHLVHRRQELGRILLVVNSPEDLAVCKATIGHRVDLLLKPTDMPGLLFKWLFTVYDLILFHHPQRIPAIPQVAHRLRPVWFLDGESFVEAQAKYDLNIWLTFWINFIWRRP